jgi:CRP-like cAMP-binding protein
VLRNRLLGALSAAEYARVQGQLKMRNPLLGRTIHAQGARITAVHFPNGGVFSVTTQMHDGTLVEVATVGIEGMLGIGVFLGDRVSAGRTLLQVPNGRLPTLSVAQFSQATGVDGAFRQVMGRYVHANLLQVMQSAACNALHDVTQRCCRWLLQTQDRVGASEFLLKQEFLAMMLGVQRPTVTHVLGGLQRAGVLSTRYGRIRILDRPALQRASCECYGVIRDHFQRLRL